MPMEGIHHFLDQMTQWASKQSDILALAVVGSHARNAAKETSDVDIVLITTQPDAYLSSRNWIEQFGRVEKQQVEYYGLLTSIRAWYADGREIEFGITGEQWAQEPLDEGTRQVIADGMRVLFENGALLSRHLQK